MKTYYFSFDPETFSQAYQNCQSFDMIPAAPHDQSEYDYLEDLIKELPYFASDGNKNLWISGGKELNFEPSWTTEDAKNQYSNNEESCMGI